MNGWPAYLTLLLVECSFVMGPMGLISRCCHVHVPASSQAITFYFSSKMLQQTASNFQDNRLPRNPQRFPCLMLSTLPYPALPCLELELGLLFLYPLLPCSPRSNIVALPNCHAEGVNETRTGLDEEGQMT